MENKEKKVYTAEEIRAITPNYRGKPENFDPNKKQKKTDQIHKIKAQTQPKVKSIEVPPPTHLQSKACAQRNKSIIGEAIFGVDVTVTEIELHQSFSANYSKIIDISQCIYDELRVDERQIDRIVVKRRLAIIQPNLI